MYSLVILLLCTCAWVHAEWRIGPLGLIYFCIKRVFSNSLMFSARLLVVTAHLSSRWLIEDIKGLNCRAGDGSRGAWVIKSSWRRDPCILGHIRSTEHDADISRTCNKDSSRSHHWNLVRMNIRTLIPRQVISNVPLCSLIDETHFQQILRMLLAFLKGMPHPLILHWVFANPSEVHALPSIHRWSPRPAAQKFDGTASGWQNMWWSR
jgi:hypothetical protein